MAFCKECGKIIDNSAPICPYCRADQRSKEEPPVRLAAAANRTGRTPAGNMPARSAGGGTGTGRTPRKPNKPTRYLKPNKAIIITVALLVVIAVVFVSYAVVTASRSDKDEKFSDTAQAGTSSKKGISVEFGNDPDDSGDAPAFETVAPDGSDTEPETLLETEPETETQTPPETESETEPETESETEPERAIQTPSEELGFISDLSAYEQYMDPEGDLRDAFLILVNKNNPIGSDYKPAELEYVPQKYCAYSGEYQATMVPYAARAMTAMLTEAENYGINDIKITLAYRSYAVENYLYNQYYNEEKALHPDWTDEQCYAMVETYKAPPGKGEHQTGLCADMHNLYNRSDVDIDDFKYTEAYAWFRENCWKFGFILRFPEGKEDITTYKFESWHYRYVGRYHAERIYKSELTLEEYIALNG